MTEFALTDQPFNDLAATTLEAPVKAAPTPDAVVRPVSASASSAPAATANKVVASAKTLVGKVADGGLMVFFLIGAVVLGGVTWFLLKKGDGRKAYFRK